MKNKRLILCGLIPLALVAAPFVASAEVTHPQEIIDRPRTNPLGQVTVGGDLGINFQADPDDDGPAEGGTTMGLGLFGRYGVSDAFEVGVGYAFSLKDFEAKGDLSFEAALGVLNSGNLQVAPQVRLGYNLLLEVIDPIGIGARVQLKLNDTMALYSGGNQLIVTVDSFEILGVEGPKPVFLRFPVGFGMQVNSNLFAFAETTVAQIEISDSETGFLFADFVPLQLGAFFSPSNTLDVGAALDWHDVADAPDDLSINLMGRLHI